MLDTHLAWKPLTDVVWDQQLEELPNKGKTFCTSKINLRHRICSVNKLIPVAPEILGQKGISGKAIKFQQCPNAALKGQVCLLPNKIKWIRKSPKAELKIPNSGLSNSVLYLQIDMNSCNCAFKNYFLKNVRFTPLVKVLPVATLDSYLNEH